MKFIYNGRFWVGLLMALALGWMPSRAMAQTGFGLTAFNSTNVVLVDGLVTNYVTVSNATGIVLAEMYITNAFSGSVLFSDESSIDTNDFSTNTTYTVNGDTVVFAVPNVAIASVVEMAVTWQPQTGGTFTNSIGVGALIVTNTASTNLVTSVYSSLANLSVNMNFVGQAAIPLTNYWVITNDWVTYQVALTNLGPGSASGVLLTNTLPAGTVLVKASPSPSSTVSNNLVFSPGTMAQGAAAVYNFTIEATNTGAYALTASASAPNLLTSGSSSNEFTAALFVTNYLAASFTVTTNSGQAVNQQNGLIEQTINIVNTGGSSNPAVRVVISGLTNQLYNVTGTNNGLPYVVCPAALAPGGSLGMRLQFAPRLPYHFTNGQLHAYALPSSVLYYSPKPFTNTVSGYYLKQMLTNGINNGSFLLEFTNQASSYTVVYSDNDPLFSHPMIATPAVSSEANRIQWIDYGPPETVSAPTNTAARYYMVIPNP